MKCYVYIDESGEAGLSKIRKGSEGGASPYFALGASVIPECYLDDLRDYLTEIESGIGKGWKHATDLSHSQTVHFARKAAESEKIRFFGVLSNKSTLGEYKEMIESEPQKFYNKCAIYLFEIVCWYLETKGYTSEPPEIIFEERNHNYEALRNYVKAIQKNPLHTNAKHIKLINPFAISSRPKNKEALLKFADLASYSVYQCANKTKQNFQIPEPRYLKELSHSFGADASGKVLGKGLKCIHTLDQLELDEDINSTIKSLRGRKLIRGR